MGKREFVKQYKTLTEEKKLRIKAYYEQTYKTAIFEDTFDTAEKCLLWIREVEEGY